MIYVDMKCLQLNKCFDLRFDEMLTVNELLKELAGYFEIRSDLAEIVSVREKQILNKGKTFFEQDVAGGDRLILVENDAAGGDRLILVENEEIEAEGVGIDEINVGLGEE